MQRKLRIAQIVGKWNTGGVRTMVLSYVKNINSDDIVFDIFIDDNSEDIKADDISQINANKYLMPSVKNPIKQIAFLKNEFKKNKYDAVHIHNNTLSVFALFAAMQAKIPVRICHSHSSAHKSESKMRLAAKYMLRPFVRLFATDYVACGELAGRWMYGDKLYDSKKVTVFANAIDTIAFLYDENDRKSYRKEFNLDENDFVIGHAGRFFHQKNHKKLIEIFKAVKSKKTNAKLLLLGTGELLSEIKNIVNDDDKIKDSVVFAGVRKDISKIYSAMDVFCLPSFFEGMPVVAPEAQTNGLLFICSDTVSKEALLTSLAHSVHLNETDEEWANIILKEYDKIKTRKSFDDAIIKSGFDIKNEAKKLRDLYLLRCK